MSTLSEKLPESYVYSDAVTAEEVIALRDVADWGTDRDIERWQRVIAQSITTVGVKDTSGTLVGVGFLAGNLRHAVLCDFVVHPDHRGNGIGKAILNKRLNIADNMEIPYLYTELGNTNKLRPYYEELGFIATGQAYTRAARRHPLEFTV